jgi:nitrous oxide reductase accessory protein NosL
MKKILYITLFIITSLFAQESKFIKSAQTENATILQKGKSKAWCSVCGMNLKMFYKTNHAVKLDNGTTKQYCSIRCFAADEHNHKDHINKILVVDAKTEKFITAKKAFYVIGSKVPGTMTKVSKIAFAKKEDADEFSKKYYGKKILDFNSALQLAKEQLKTDNAMLMKKKEMKIYPKGEKLFGKIFGKKFELPKVKSISELKAILKQNEKTKQLNEKKLQMLAVYLWDVKINKHTHNKIKTAIGNIPKDAKCPVCGMFVYKYPRWAAVLEVSNNGKQQKLYFDGVKDLMKFYYAPKKWGDYKNVKLLSIDVTDYYQQKKIAGEDAYYVIGSDILGPMGNELIPFEKEEDAKVFSKDHFGKKILSFNELTEDIVKNLDE